MISTRLPLYRILYTKETYSCPRLETQIGADGLCGSACCLALQLRKERFEQIKQLVQG